MKSEQQRKDELVDSVTGLSNLLQQYSKKIDQLEEKIHNTEYVYEPVKMHFGSCGLSRDNVRGLVINSKSNVEQIREKNKMEEALRDIWRAFYAKNSKGKGIPYAKRLAAIGPIIDAAYKDQLFDDLPF